jgi:hypothetical protein
MAVTFTFGNQVDGNEPDGFLDVPAASREPGVQVQRYYQLHGGLNQQWELIELPIDFAVGFNYQIRSVSSGLVLGVPHMPPRDGDPVIQERATGQANQSWWFERAEGVYSGFVYWVHPLRSPMVMGTDINNRMVQLRAVRGVGAASAWHIQVKDNLVYPPPNQ